MKPLPFAAKPRPQPKPRRTCLRDGTRVRFGAIDHLCPQCHDRMKYLRKHRPAEYARRRYIDRLFLDSMLRGARQVGALPPVP